MASSTASLVDIVRGHSAYAHYYLPLLRGERGAPKRDDRFDPFSPVRLYLARTDMEDSDLRAIGLALAEWRHKRATAENAATDATPLTPLITELDLSGNPRLTDEGIRTFFETLQLFPACCVRLRRVSLAELSFIISDKTRDVLAAFLKTTHTISSFVLCDVSLPCGPEEEDSATLAPGGCDPHARLRHLAELNQHPLLVKMSVLAAVEQDYHVTALDFSQPAPTAWQDTPIDGAPFPIPVPPAAALDFNGADGQGGGDCRWVTVTPGSYGLAATRAVTQALAHNCTIGRVIFDNNCVGDDSAVALSEFLKTNTSVTELSLRHNKIGTRGGCALVEALRVGPNRSLTELDLTSNRICDIVGERLIQLVSSGVSSVGYVALEDNCISPGVVARLHQALMLNTQPAVIKDLVPLLQANNASMTRIISHNAVPAINDITTRVLLHALRNNSVVSYIDLSNNSITDDGAFFISEIIQNNNKTLKAVKLQSNLITDIGAKMLMEAITANPLLETLDLRFQSPTEVSAGILDRIAILVQLPRHPRDLQTCGLRIVNDDPSLTEVRLDRYDGRRRCTHETIELLGAACAMNTHVRELYLGNNAGFIAASAMPCICELAQRLTRLDLTRFGLTDDLAVNFFPDMIKSNTSLRILCLDKNEALTDALVTALVPVLRRWNHTLREVSLVGNNRITASAAEELSYCTALNANSRDFKTMILAVEGNSTSVSTITMSHVIKMQSGSSSHCFKKEYDDASVSLLCRALARNTSVTSVDLSGNHITDDGGQRLATMLRGNSTITRLDVSFNEMTDVGLREMARAMAETHAVRVFQFQGNVVKEVSTEKHIFQCISANATAPVSVYASMQTRAKKSAAQSDVEHAVMVDQLLDAAILQDAMADFKAQQVKREKALAADPMPTRTV